MFLSITIEQWLIYSTLFIRLHTIIWYKYSKWSNLSIWPIDGILIGITIPVQSLLGSNLN